MTDSAKSEGALQPRDAVADVEAEAPDGPSGERSLVDFSFKVPAIALLLAAGLVLRLVLATLPGFAVDLGTFQAWANALAAHGPWNFYDTDFFVDYAPGYLYVLWLIGKAHQFLGFSPDQYNYVLKLPAIAAEVASAY